MIQWVLQGFSPRKNQHHSLLFHPRELGVGTNRGKRNSRLREGSNKFHRVLGGDRGSLASPQSFLPFHWGFFLSPGMNEPPQAQNSQYSKEGNATCSNYWSKNIPGGPTNPSHVNPQSREENNPSLPAKSRAGWHWHILKKESRQQSQPSAPERQSHTSPVLLPTNFGCCWSSAAHLWCWMLLKELSVQKPPAAPCWLIWGGFPDVNNSIFHTRRHQVHPALPSPLQGRCRAGGKGCSKPLWDEWWCSCGLSSIIDFLSGNVSLTEANTPPLMLPGL